MFMQLVPTLITRGKGLIVTVCTQGGRVYPAPNITVIKLRKTNEAEQIASIGNMKNSYKTVI